MSSVVRKFEMCLGGIITLYLSSCELCFLYSFSFLYLLMLGNAAPDESLYLIYTINRLVQVRAGILESNMKDFLHSFEGIYPKGNGNGIVQSDQTIRSVSGRSMYVDGNHKISEEFPGRFIWRSSIQEFRYYGRFHSMPKTDLQKIQADCLAIGAIQVLLKLKWRLKIFFSLYDTCCVLPWLGRYIQGEVSVLVPSEGFMVEARGMEIGQFLQKQWVCYSPRSSAVAENKHS